MIKMMNGTLTNSFPVLQSNLTVQWASMVSLFFVRDYRVKLTL